MEIKIARWGNNLAVRLPASYARRAGLRAGDSVKAEVTASGELHLSPRKPFDKAAFLRKVKTLHARLPPTEGVMAALRARERF